MRLGVAVRIMGEAAHADTMLRAAQHAEAVGLDEIFVVDHIAIPPDDAEGSGGRYLDPLAALSWLAAKTERIGIGTAVLILPYRPPLPTAKAIATIQELSGGRVTLGVGVGWMKPEFQALGVDRSQRGALTDATLDVFRRCFDAEDDVVVLNGQPFLFRPRPPRPRILVGGAGPHALARAVRYGDGWLPMSSDPDKLGPAIAELHRLAEEAGAPRPEVACLGGLDADPLRAADQLNDLAALGVTRFLTGARYDRDPAPCLKAADHLAAVREQLPG